MSLPPLCAGCFTTAFFRNIIIIMSYALMKFTTDMISSTKKYAPIIPIVMVITVSATVHLSNLFIIYPP